MEFHHAVASYNDSVAKMDYWNGQFVSLHALGHDFYDRSQG